MDLSNLKAAEGSVHSGNFRRGRGHGSGNGKTAGKGHKGQKVIPAYDYCVPDKESTSTTDDPCEVFKKIKFPVNQFFPPKLSECDQL